MPSSLLRYSPLESEGDVHDGTTVDDNALRATEGTLCHACGAPLTVRDFVRVISKDTRHDSCP